MKKKTRKTLINWWAILVAVALVVIAIQMQRGGGGESGDVFGDDAVQMHYFYSRTCKYCQAQERYHSALQEAYPTLQIIKHEVSFPDNVTLYKQMAPQFPDINPTRISTPTSMIGDQVNVGFGGDASVIRLRQMIEMEMQRIEKNWDPETMIRTVDLRNNSDLITDTPTQDA